MHVSSGFTAGYATGVGTPYFGTVALGTPYFGTVALTGTLLLLRAPVAARSSSVPSSVPRRRIHSPEPLREELRHR